MSKILKDIYRKPFQKSKIFLYPNLDIKRGSSTTPIETYVAWKDKFIPDDHRLIAMYHLRNDAEFVAFEERMLVGNKYYEEYIDIGNDKALYIFNFEELAHDFDNFILGKYSRLSLTVKNNIKRFYGGNSSSYAFIESWLYPEKFYKNYAQILYNSEDRVVGEKLIKGTRELCNKPNFDNEVLDLVPAVVEL